MISDEVINGKSTEQKAPGSAGRAIALSTAFVSSAFLLSRILGLLRDWVILQSFKINGPIAEYRAAFAIPDLLFLIVMGGALTSAFIPVFSRFLLAEDKESAWKLASTVLNLALGILVAAAATAWLLMPWIIDLEYPSPQYSADQRVLIVSLSRILLLSPFFLGLGGIASGILNSFHRFALPAIAPLLYNLMIIFGALFLAKPFGIYGVVYGVVAGAALIFFVQVPGLLRVGFRYSLAFKPNVVGLKDIFWTLLPRFFGQIAFQANWLVILHLVPDKAIQALYTAYSLMILPHGIFAMSIATVTYPTMAKQFALKDLTSLRETVAIAIRTVIFLSLPITVLYGVLNHEIIKCLFNFGFRFDADATNQVSLSLFYFSFGVISYVVVEIATRAFYAQNDSMTPVIIACATVVVNVILSNWLITTPLGDNGPVLGLVLTTTVEMICLVPLLHRRLGNLDDATTLKELGKMFLAALVMALIVLSYRYFLDNTFEASGKIGQIALLSAAVGGSGFVYLGGAILLRIKELQTTWLILRRKIKRA